MLLKLLVPNVFARWARDSMSLSDSRSGTSRGPPETRPGSNIHTTGIDTPDPGGLVVKHLPALNLSCWPFLFIKGVDDFGEDEWEKLDNFFYLFLIRSLMVYQNCTRTYTLHANVHIF